MDLKSGKLRWMGLCLMWPIRLDLFIAVDVQKRYGASRPADVPCDSTDRQSPGPGAPALRFNGTSATTFPALTCVQRFARHDTATEFSSIASTRSAPIVLQCANFRDENDVPDVPEVLHCRVDGDGDVPEANHC